MHKNGKHAEKSDKPSIPETMTFKEVIDYLGVSDTTINKYVKLGLLTKGKRRFGLSRVYFLRQEVEAFKQSQQVTLG